MLRSTFLKRMALAAAACAFIDVPWPKAREVAAPIRVLHSTHGHVSLAGRRAVLAKVGGDGDWHDYATGTFQADGSLLLDA